MKRSLLLLFKITLLCLLITHCSSEDSDSDSSTLLRPILIVYGIMGLKTVVHVTTVKVMNLLQSLILTSTIFQLRLLLKI